MPVSLFFFHVSFDTPFKFIVSFSTFYFIRITEAVLMRTIRGELCYMADAIQLVVDLARSSWTDCSLRFDQVTLLAIGKVGGKCGDGLIGIILGSSQYTAINLCQYWMAG